MIFFKRRRVFFVLFSFLISMSFFSHKAWGEENKSDRKARINKYYYTYGGEMCSKGQYAYAFDYLIKIPKDSEYFEKAQGCVQAFYDLMAGKKVTPPKIELLETPEKAAERKKAEEKKIAREKKEKIRKMKIADEKRLAREKKEKINFRRRKKKKSGK